MTFEQIIESFSQQRIVIVGDVMIDAYIWGEHTRMSPEAPVPVVDVSNREARLGGAANVALNIKATGAEPIILTVLGERGRSDEYIELMNADSISMKGVVMSPERRTSVKTRVISNSKHMLRVDEEDKYDLSKTEEEALISRLDEIFLSEKVDAIILQDYNKGVLTSSSIERILSRARSHDIPTMVDPKQKNFTSYSGCTLFKPNLKELREGLGISIDSISKDVMDEALKELKDQMPHDMSMVTLSEHGVYWSDGKESGIMPIFDRTIVDVSGAGDTVVSIATLALAGGARLSQAALLANLAGGLVCEHVGVQPIDKETLKQEVLSNKL